MRQAASDIMTITAFVVGGLLMLLFALASAPIWAPLVCVHVFMSAIDRHFGLGIQKPAGRRRPLRHTSATNFGMIPPKRT